MTHLITIEQAVEAVNRCTQAAGGLAVEDDVLDRACAALRSMPPAEPTEEDVERVAAVIFNKVQVMSHRDYQAQDGYDGWRTVARAAIAAMRGGR